MTPNKDLDRTSINFIGSQRPGYGWPCSIEQQEAEGGENKNIQTMLFFS